jgi:CheY-like chemotaxis protein
MVLCPRRTARILVAEDDAAMRSVVVDVLKKDGHIVEQAADGQEVLARLALGDQEAREVDVIVCDVRMPDVTGFQILEALRASKRTTQFILMTAFGDHEMRARALKLGALLFDKPFPVDQLRSCVAQLLAKRG